MILLRMRQRARALGCRSGFTGDRADRSQSVAAFEIVVSIVENDVWPARRGALVPSGAPGRGLAAGLAYVRRSTDTARHGLDRPRRERLRSPRRSRSRYRVEPDVHVRSTMRRVMILLAHVIFAPAIASMHMRLPA